MGARAEESMHHDESHEPVADVDLKGGFIDHLFVMC
jgi:hypothetical protein